jgi:hypothetical protein
MAEHDLLFKRAFRVPEHAAGELAAVLPKAVLDTIDQGSLELVQGDFVGQKLDERFSDALFKESSASISTWLPGQRSSTSSRARPRKTPRPSCAMFSLLPATSPSRHCKTAS